MQIGSTNTSTINIGVSGDTINIPSGVTIANAGTATGFASAVTPDNLQYLSLSGNQTISANTMTTITGWSNGQIADRLLINYGTQYATNSSGIISFSTEGYYHVVLRTSGSTTGASNVNAYINSTTNNSSYADAIDVNVGTFGSGGFNYYMDGIFKITDTSNHKLQMQIYMPSNGGEVAGNSTRLFCMATGDTSWDTD
jgi:hypothetical protein